MLPHQLASLHPRYATPARSILVNSVGVALLIPFSFQELIQIDMFLYALALILEFAALVWLRLRKPDLPRPYRMPFGMRGLVAMSLPPVALCLVSMAIANDVTKTVALAGIAVGLAVYWLQRKSSAESPTEPAPVEITEESIE
jgi:amino acid transporter